MADLAYTAGWPKEAHETCGLFSNIDEARRRRRIGVTFQPKREILLLICCRCSNDEMINEIQSCTRVKPGRLAAEPSAVHSPAPLSKGLSAGAKTRKVVGRIGIFQACRENRADEDRSSRQYRRPAPHGEAAAAEDRLCLVAFRHVDEITRQ